MFLPFDHAPMYELALGDSLTVGMGVFQLVFSAIVSVSLWRLSAAQRQYEGLEQKLHETTTRLVDERFRAMTHEINVHVQGFVLTLEELKQRLQTGESDFRVLGDRDQKIELALTGKIDVLKDWIRDNAASKKDLEKNEQAVEQKLTRIEHRMAELNATVAVLNDKTR